MCRNVAPCIRFGREIPQNPRLLRERARLLFANLPFTCKSSIKTAWFGRQRQVVSLWVGSARILAMRARSRATRLRFLVIFGNRPMCSLGNRDVGFDSNYHFCCDDLAPLWVLLSCPRSAACNCTTIALLPAGPQPAPSLVKRNGRYAHIVGDVASEPSTGKTVGVDVGQEHFVTLLDGTTIPNPQWYRTAERRLKQAQRRLSRRVKGSNRYHKARELLAKAHLKVKRAR